jgi:hypothetical protein
VLAMGEREDRSEFEAERNVRERNDMIGES